MALDPTFAPSPAERNAMQMSDSIFGSLSRPAYQREAEYLREDIAGLEEDLACDEKRIRAIQFELPALEIELLSRQRDVAVKRLKLYELRAKLDAKTGGTQ